MHHLKTWNKELSLFMPFLVLKQCPFQRVPHPAPHLTLFGSETMRQIGNKNEKKPTVSRRGASRHHRGWRRSLGSAGLAVLAWQSLWRCLHNLTRELFTVYWAERTFRTASVCLKSRSHCISGVGWCRLNALILCLCVCVRRRERERQNIEINGLVYDDNDYY